MVRQFTANEVGKHNARDDCWVVLYGKVYDVLKSEGPTGDDKHVYNASATNTKSLEFAQTRGQLEVTNFLPEHPGGSSVILRLAGRDATKEYDPVHPPGTLEENLPESACLGTIDGSTLPKPEASPQSSEAGTDAPVSISHLLNIEEIEAAGSKQLSKKAWAYYYSASDDLYTKNFNNTIYRDVLLRPRVFKDCTRCSLSTRIAGEKVDTPVFVSPAAMARLAHPSGEAGIAAACAKFGACQIISNNASMTPEQIVADAKDDQVFGWQLYVQVDRRKSEKMLERINALKPKICFVVLTLDAPVPGKREDDERQSQVGASLPVNSATQEGEQKKGESGGIGKDLFQGTAADLTWRTTLPWLAKHTDLPIILKGIQTHEDAAIAAAHAPQVKGIILSNHGGRAMDTAQPPLLTLLEVRKYCPWVFERVEVMVDGGIKRGTDVVKALCLGAKAVGIGRAVLFGLSAGGPEGVERMFEILNGEISTAMRLLGVERIEDLNLQHVNTRMAMQRLYDGPSSLPIDERLLSKL